MDSELSQLSAALSFYLTLSSTSILHSELHFSNSPINYNTSKFPNQLFPNQLQHQQIPGSITTIKPASILKLIVFNLVHIPPNNDSSEQFNQQKKNLSISTSNHALELGVEPPHASLAPGRPLVGRAAARRPRLRPPVPAPR